MNDILKNSKTTNSLTWTKKAELKILPDVLPWHVIGPLINLELADAYTDAITKALFDRDLKVFNPSWSEETKQENIALHGLAAITPQVHKAEFKRWWLIRVGEWPVNGLLANWWADEEEPQQADTPKPETRPPKQNEMERSGLLKRIRGEDAWYDLIDDTTKALYDQLRRMPNEAQVWGMMWSNPPLGYTITPGKDKGGEDCLNMPGEPPLSRSAFAKRWKRYTKPPIKTIETH